LEEPVVCHSLLSNPARNNFQTMLHHQPWRESYSLKFGEQDGFSQNELEIIRQQVTFYYYFEDVSNSTK
jgi:hypothetical protein